MKQNKPVIIVVIILAVLFVLSQGSYYLQDKEKRDEKPDPKNVKELVPEWIATIRNALPPFRSAFDIERLDPEPTCLVDQIEEKTYKLTSNEKCEIYIASNDEAKVQKATLTVANDSVKIKVCHPEEDKSQPVSGSSNDAGDVLQQPLELLVYYCPGCDEEGTETCEETKEVHLMVLKNGGTLRLQCKGCSHEPDRSVTVTLK